MKLSEAFITAALGLVLLPIALFMQSKEHKVAEENKRKPVVPEVAKE